MMSSRRCLPVGFRRAFQAAALLLLMPAPAAAQAPAGPAPTKTSTGPVLAAFVAASGIRRTPGHVPLVLKIYNNSNKPIRLLDLFTPKLFPVAVRFNLEPSGTPGLGASLFYGLKASLYSWQYVYITVKPHHAFQTSFDLAQMTTDKQPIPPGRYKPSGYYGANMGYPPGMGSGADVFNGEANIPPIDLVIDAPAKAEAPAGPAPAKTFPGQAFPVFVPNYAGLAPEEVIPLTEEIDKQQEAIRIKLFSQAACLTTLKRR